MCQSFLTLFPVFTCPSEPYTKSSGAVVCTFPIFRKVPFQSATKLCQSKGAFLPYVTTIREQEYVHALKRMVSEIWVIIQKASDFWNIVSLLSSEWELYG